MSGNKNWYKSIKEAGHICPIHVLSISVFTLFSSSYPLKSFASPTELLSLCQAKTELLDSSEAELKRKGIDLKLKDEELPHLRGIIESRHVNIVNLRREREGNSHYHLSSWILHFFWPPSSLQPKMPLWSRPQHELKPKDDAIAVQQIYKACQGHQAGTR